MADAYTIIPCETCKGGKLMMKLGGIYGECNTCKGIGEVRKLKPKEESKITFYDEKNKEYEYPVQDLEKNKELNKSKNKNIKKDK